MYQLKGLKTFNGMEGGGYEASLYRDSKKIGTAMNGGDGGCDHFVFINREEESAFQAFVEHWYETSDAKREYESFCKENDVDPKSSAMDKMEHWVAEEEHRMQEQKWLKRAAKTKTPFRLVGDEKYAWRTVNATGEKAVRFIQEKYGAQVKTIYGIAVPGTATTGA